MYDACNDSILYVYNNLMAENYNGYLMFSFFLNNSGEK